MNAASLPIPLPRHSLVWLSAQGWQQAQAGAADASRRAALQRWQQANWPAVVRRADADAGLDDICAGVALPPDASGHKLRIPVRIARVHVTSSCPALSLSELLRRMRSAPAQGIPEHWLAALEQLYADISQSGLTLRVYGSLALQVLTGLPYVRDSSDIDLLLQPQHPSELEQGMTLLARHARSLPLDGELLLPGDSAVAWKEWRQAGPGDRVLVKRLHEVALQRADSLLALLDAWSAARAAA